MVKKTIKKLIGISMITMVVMGAMVGCGNTSSKEASKLEKVKENKKIVLGTSADYPPYEFHKMIDGKDSIIGFDIDIAREIAKEIGVELEIKDMSFDGLLPALDSNTVDMVLAGMNPTPERAKSVDFSDIYYKAVHGIVVRQEDKDKIKSLSDLKGKKVGVQKASVQEELAKEQIQGAEFKSLSKITDLTLELKNNKIDAIVVEVPVAEFYVSKNNDLVLTDLKLNVEESESGSSVAFKKDSKELVEIANKVIKRLKSEDQINKFFIEANKQVEE